MLKKRREAVERVTESLFAAECAIDDAVTRTAALAGLIPVVRQEAELAACVGQEAMERAIETLKVLGEARRLIVQTHEDLAATQRRIGVRTTSTGGWNGKDEEPVGLRLATVEAA